MPFYTNSIFLVLMPCGCEVVFLQTVQVYLKSVFLLLLAPVRLNFVNAGLEYLPQLPIPLARPLNLARYFDPRVKELAAFFLAWTTFCSVCFLQNLHNRLIVLGIFIIYTARSMVIYKGFLNYPLDAKRLKIDGCNNCAH